METKTKLGQNPAYPTLEQSGYGGWNTFPGMTERQKIAADVLCALIKSGKYDIRLDVEGEAVYNHIVCKRALSITDTFLELESE